MKLARTSPSIKRSETDVTMDMVSSDTAGVPSSPDVTNISNMTHSDHRPSDNSNITHIQPCSVLLKDILVFDDTVQHCRISNCETKGCTTCEILITDVEFTSNLTKKSYFTRSNGDLNCKSITVVYGLECNLCGLVYVGETKGRLNKRMCGHRSDINLNCYEILYQHFN